MLCTMFAVCTEATVNDTRCHEYLPTFYVMDVQTHGIGNNADNIIIVSVKIVLTGIRNRLIQNQKHV